MVRQRRLKRELSLFSIIAIAAGSTLGGWLVEAPYWFELTGAGAAILFPIIAILLLPVGLAFAELTSMLPFNSSVDVWSSNAMNPAVGWAAQWSFFLVQVVEPPLVAFIFVTTADYFVELPTAAGPLIAIGIMVLWYIIANFNIRLTGTLAIVFFLGMLALTVIVSLYFFFSGDWRLVNITQHGGLFPFGATGAVVGAAALVLKYIGFGMTPTLIQETKFPAKKMVTVIAAALFIPAVVYLFATFALAGLAPHTVIAEMAIPAPQLVDQLDMLGIIGILAIVAGLLYAFTTIMGFWVSSARVLYGFSQLRQLPPWFTKTNSHGQPYIANIVVLAFGIFFAAFTNTNFVQYIYSLSVVAAGVVYFFVCLSAYILRKRRPDWERPYKTRAGEPMFIFGMIISGVVAVVGVTLLPPSAWLPIAIYILIGILIPIAMKYYRRRVGGDYSPLVLTPDDKRDFDAV